MNAAMIFLTGMIFIHIVGILLLLLNSLFVVCTRDKENEEKRCCKIGNDLACNLLFLYHSILVILELCLALLNQITDCWKDISPNQNLADIFIISAGVNYLFCLAILDSKDCLSGYNGRKWLCQQNERYKTVRFYQFLSILVPPGFNPSLYNGLLFYVFISYFSQRLRNHPIGYMLRINVTGSWIHQEVYLKTGRCGICNYYI